MRTEEQVLKDFEQLGYRIKEIMPRHIILETEFYGIQISKFFESYYCYNKDQDGSAGAIRMIEHKLLHELFKIWGWIE